MGKERKIKKIAKKFFETVYEKYGDIVPPGIQELDSLEFFFDKLKNKRVSNILDVACGLGFLTKYLNERFHPINIIGVDISDKLIDKAQILNKSKNIKFETADSEVLTFPDKNFDLITCRYAFHHFPSPIKVLREMKRVLNDDGEIVIIDPSFKKINNDILINNIFTKLEKDIAGHIKFYNKSEFEQFAKKVKLELVEIVYMDLNFILGLPGFCEEFQSFPDNIKEEFSVSIQGSSVHVKFPVAATFLQKNKD